MHNVSSEYCGRCSLVSGSMWTRDVDKRTPPPKQSKQDSNRGCRCLAASEKQAGSMPEKKAPRPNVSMDIALAVVISILVDFLFPFLKFHVIFCFVFV